MKKKYKVYTEGVYEVEVDPKEGMSSEEIADKVEEEKVVLFKGFWDE